MQSARSLLIIASLTAVTFGTYAALKSITPPSVEPVFESVPTASEIYESEAAAATSPLQLPIEVTRSDTAVFRHSNNSGDGQTAQLRDLKAWVTSLEVTVATLEQQLKALAATVSHLPTRADLDRIADAAASGILLGDEGVLPPSEMLEMQQAEQEAAAQQYMALVENSFWSEPVDWQWSSQALAIIQQALNNEALPAMTVLSTDCRSTLCRIELQQDDPQVLDEVSSQLMGQVSSLLPQMTMDYIDQGNGWTTTILYLAREGYSLP